MTGWRRAFRLRLRRSDVDREIEDELDFHIERTVDRLIDKGMPRDEAVREARARFGDRDRHGRRARRIARRRFRKHRLHERIHGAARDVRLAVRSLLRRPAFTGSTVLVLGAGIAASTTVYSFARAVLLTPLPYPNPEALVRIQEMRTPDAPGMLLERNLVLGDIERIRDRATRLAGVAGFLSVRLPFSDETGARRIPSGSVDRHLFGLFGANPVLGRAFTEEDMQTGAARVAVIGHRTWLDRFGGSPDVLGRTLELNFEPYRIVGVMPPGFDFPDGAEVWRPLLPTTFAVRFHVVQAIGRLAPGATPESAEEELSTLALGWSEAEPDVHGAVTGARVRGWQDQLVAEVRPAMLLLGGAVGLLMLLVCVNVGGLLTARALEREREVALRRSLGASPGRLARTVVLESLLLAVAGGGLGFLVSYATLGRVVALSPADLPARDLVAADGGVALFTASLAVAIGLLAGLLPALRAARVAAPTALGAGGRGTVRAGGSGLKGGALIAVEVGMATLLVVGGGLLLHSFVRMLRIDTGIERLDLLTASVSMPPGYDGETGFQFFERLRSGALALPGVTDVALSMFAPLNGSIPISGVTVPGGSGPDDGDERVGVLSVTPEYFGLVGIPVIEGRAFRDADDDRGAPRVAIVSRGVARRLWGQRDPIGRVLSIGEADARRLHGADELRVVGVAEDVRQNGPLVPPPPLLYVPFEQYIAWSGGTLTIASNEDPAALVPAVRDLVRRLDPRIPIDRIETLAQSVSGSVAEPRFFTVLVVGFAVLASLVAVAGLYGILAYDVRRRLVELGIRAVLGARPRDNVLLLLRRGALWVSLGIAGGVLAAVPLTGALESLVYGIEPHDPATIAGAGVLMLVVGIAAALVPAAHATHADPGVAIRAD